MLTLEGIGLTLGANRVLHNVSAQFRDGTLTGIIGPNGAGKTSLLRVAAGLCAPQAGDIALPGVDFADPQARAKALAYLPQFQNVAWPLVGRDVVALGLLPYGDNLPDGAARIEAALTRCGALGFAERAIDTLSGGEAARVHLARLLVGHARLLLLDEPVQSLDAAGALAVMGLLRAAASDGLAVALVLHDMTLAAQFCDRILLMDKGRLVAQGTPDEVLSASQLTPIFGVEFDAIEAQGHKVLVPRA